MQLIGNRTEKLKKELDKRHEEFRRIAAECETLRESLRLYQSDYWRETVEQILKPELDRVAHREHGLPLFKDGQPNLIEIAQAKGQYNEVKILLAREGVLKKALEQRQEEYNAAIETLEQAKKKLARTAGVETNDGSSSND